ncbi:MAG: hypothetical protein OXI88_15005 [Gammaproteobacteria bacterium]|nr:hypothetical protein [Gammaproteobacteria bacterium]MDE0284121.1 hypothetical protein [Gammaproteobacteria bacterium]MDE0513085.1 hypothetical protein [Gammaproteobacteria bacterium]
MGFSEVGIAHIFLYTIVVLFPVANPVGLSVPFHVMTNHMENRQRRTLAWRVALYFFLLVAGVLLLGTLVLKAFSLSPGILDIAGGLVLFHTAWNMLHGTDEHQQLTSDKSDKDIGFFPLTMPLTADAAVLAVALSLSNSILHHWDFHVLVEYGAALGGIGVIALTIGVLYGSSHSTVGWMGQNALKAATSLVALLMLGVAIEIFVTGIRDITGTF